MTFLQTIPDIFNPVEEISRVGRKFIEEKLVLIKPLLRWEDNDDELNTSLLKLILDNKLESKISKNLFKFLNKNKTFKQYLNIFADKGIYINY